eukprot:3344463-Karenia_brevis.AAC.1
MIGAETWIVLPEEGRPEGWQYLPGWGTYKRPVVRMRKALYGHPDAGTIWEKHCDERVQAAGYKPVGPDWPSCYFHDELKLYLCVYVDDFKLSGPQENLADGWRILREGATDGLSPILLEDSLPIGYNSDTGERDGKTLYLGCYHKIHIFQH